MITHLIVKHTFSTNENLYLSFHHIIYYSMKLADKGPMAPPPILSAYPQVVSAAIQQWKDIIAVAHWDLNDETKIDGADFYVGKDELGHIHLDGSVHLATVKELRVPLVNHKLAEKFP